MFETLVQFGAERLGISTSSEEEQNLVQRKLRSIDEFLLVMIKLRLGLLDKDLEYRFKISSSTVSKICKTWIEFMFRHVQSFILMPKLKKLQKNAPECFQSFADVRIILDCTEIDIETPSSSNNQSPTYSGYKSQSTFKVLLGMSITGEMVYISELFNGSVSEVEIIAKSGLLEKLESGDAVIVDKGFADLKPYLQKIGVKLYCPALDSDERLTKTDSELSRCLDFVRKIVGRKIEQIRAFRLLQGVMPIDISKQANEIVHVCATLTNIEHHFSLNR